MGLMQYVGQVTCSSLTLSANCYNPNMAVSLGFFVILAVSVLVGAAYAGSRT